VTDPDDCKIVIYGGANRPTCTCFLRSARWMKRYSNFWRSVKQSGGVASAVKHDADASQISPAADGGAIVYGGAKLADRLPAPPFAASRLILAVRKEP
jgi:hypothetical protein